MLTTVSSNAILAKSRAMYGRRLTERNYTELLNCHSVNEVANYLKNRTAYADIFEGTTTTDIHRGQLETMLKKRVFDQYASLCRYEMSIGQDFYQYFIVRSDIDQIMSCARFLSTGHPGDYLFAMPAFFNQHTKLDLYALAAVNSFESLLAALEGTPYYDMMHLFARKAPSEINFLDMEAVFQRYLYDRLEELIEKGFKGKDRKEVMSAVGMQLDMEAIVNLYRLKRMGGRSPEEIRRSVVIGPISRLRRRQFELLVEAPSAACHGEVSTVRHSDAILAVTVRSLSDCTDVAAFHGHGGIFTGYFNQTAIIRSRCIILAGNYLAFLLGRAVLQCHLAQDDDFACCAVVGSQCISVQVKNHGLSGGYTDALPCDVGIGGQFKIFAVGESGL